MRGRVGVVSIRKILSSCNGGLMRHGLIAILIVLLLALTFNAYACVVYSAAQAPMDCSSPDNEESQSTGQYCDVFKTLSVESIYKITPATHHPIGVVQDPVVFGVSACLLHVGSHYRYRPYHAIDRLHDPQLMTGVLRI